MLSSRQYRSLRGRLKTAARENICILDFCEHHDYRRIVGERLLRIAWLSSGDYGFCEHQSRRESGAWQPDERADGKLAANDDDCLLADEKHPPVAESVPADAPRQEGSREIESRHTVANGREQEDSTDGVVPDAVAEASERIFESIVRVSGVVERIAQIAGQCGRAYSPVAALV